MCFGGEISGGDDDDENSIVNMSVNMTEPRINTMYTHMHKALD